MTAEPAAEPRPDYYVPGGALKANAQSYVPRAADTQLLAEIRARHYSYVLTPRQMGKTSLMVRTAATLRGEGVRSVIVDLTQIGTQVTAEQWYLGHLKRVAKDLALGTDYLQWWAHNQHLGVVQRFVSFLGEVVVTEVAEPVVVFIDEIDTTLSLSFSDDYFAAIRSLYNQRATDDKLERLTFALLGVASPSDLIKDATRTPFNIGTRIPLTDFAESEAKALLEGLGAPTAEAATQLLRRVLHWTGGHPYLTQRTCQAVAARSAAAKPKPSALALVVDEVVRERFFSEAGRSTDPNLQFVRDRILESPQVKDLLRLYRQIRTNRGATDDELDPLRVALKLTGLVKVTDGGLLLVRNRIYEGVFDDVWIAATLGAENIVAPQETATSLFDRLGNLFGKKPSLSLFRYDVYVSYSRKDVQWVRGVLLPKLKSAKLRIFVDEADIAPGERWATAIDQAMSESRNILLVMTPAYFSSEWTERESIRAMRLLDEGQGHRVIPLMLERTAVEGPITQLQHLDFTRGAGGSNMKRLVELLTRD